MHCHHWLWGADEESSELSVMCENIDTGEVIFPGCADRSALIINERKNITLKKIAVNGNFLQNKIVILYGQIQRNLYGHKVMSMLLY